RVDVARARLDGLGDVGGELTRELRLRLNFAQRCADRRRHAGEGTPCDDAGGEQQGDEDAEPDPEPNADRVPLERAELHHWDASTCSTPSCTRVMTMPLPTGSPSVLNRMVPVTPL